MAYTNKKYKAEFKLMRNSDIPKNNAPFQIAQGRPKRKKPIKKPIKKIDLEKQLSNHFDLLGQIHKQHGAGFLSGLLGKISSTLGAIGKPIFSAVPALQPFEGLLGDNSAYHMASKGLESIGLGRKRKLKGRGPYDDIFGNNMMEKQAKILGIEHLLHGKGFFDTIKKGLSKVGDIGKNIKDRVTTVFTGITRLNPICRKILEKYGNETIKSLEVCREPVASGVATALNLVSLGTFNKAKNELGYDNFFHLFLVAEMSSGTKIRIERNEVVNMTTNIGENDKRERMPVNLLGKTITLNEFMENTKQKMGDTFLKYDARTMNCQHFVQGCLEGNGLYNNDLKKFVLQDMEGLFSRMPGFAEKIGKFTTNLGSKFNVLRNGAGKKKKLLLKSVKKSIKPFKKLNVKKIKFVD
jgi:hypothetical protein